MTSYFDPPCVRDVGDEESVQVRLKDIRLERLRDFGDVWLGWGLWRMLGLDGLLAKLLPEGREDVSWGTVAAILANHEPEVTETAPVGCLIRTKRRRGN